jgi:hypothetical protein
MNLKPLLDRFGGVNGLRFFWLCCRISACIYVLGLLGIVAFRAVT